MPNGYADMEEYLLPRLRATARSEASAYVLREWETTWEGDLAGAVIDAIEHLPARKVKQLRDWLDQVPLFSEWKKLERRGWEMDKFWPDDVLAREGDRFAVFVPDEKSVVHSFEKRGYAFDEEIEPIAAGAGAREVNYIGTNKRVRPGRTAYVFLIESVL